MPSIWTESVPKLIQSDPTLKNLVLALAQNDDGIKKALASPMMFLGFPLVDLYHEVKKPENLKNPRYYRNKKSYRKQIWHSLKKRLANLMAI